MKKLFFTLLLPLFGAGALAQITSWYVSVNAGAGLGGPKGAIKNKLEKMGYNHTASANFLGLESTIKYPKVETGIPILIRGGKKIKENKSIYLIAGTSAAGEVRGFKREGYGSFLGLISGDYGTMISIDYKITELAVGMEYTMQNSRLKLGYAPAVFLLRYHNIHSIDNSKKVAAVPGLALTGRLPFGWEKRRIGVELVADINLAPPATIRAQQYAVTDNNGVSKEVEILSSTKVNMVHGMAGLALTYRKKKNA